MPSGPMFFYQSGTCFYVYERLQKFMSFFIFITLKKKKVIAQIWKRNIPPKEEEWIHKAWQITVIDKLTLSLRDQYPDCAVTWAPFHVSRKRVKTLLNHSFLLSF